MFCIKFLLHISYLSSIKALSNEYIIGGYDAKQQDFKYQVEILARKNFSPDYIPVCGGGIISDSFLITAAHCFKHSILNLMNYSYTISAGTINLRKKKYLIDVDAIYLIQYNRKSSFNDLTVVKLKEKLNISANTFLDKLELPDSSKSFINYIGVVSGFGFTFIKLKKSSRTGFDVVVSGGSDFLLKYGHVDIIEDYRCQTRYPQINPTKQICGLMIPKEPSHRAGICNGDSGSPLVIANKQSVCDCKSILPS